MNKEYKTSENGESAVNEPAAMYETTSARQSHNILREFKIPRDESGNPIGTPWEGVLEEIYNDLSKHYGVDLRTL